MFERSPAGQRNRALFYGVDYTCYVEGGGGDPDRSIDISFWEQVLQAFRPELRVTFLPRGGKPILEGLARQIIDGDISNTIVAIDSDYDEVLGHRISDRRVLYSSGYSWENDLYEHIFIPELIRKLAHRTSVPAEITKLLTESLQQFEKDARLPIIADVLALIAGSSMIPREAPGRIVVTSSHGTGKPTFNKKEVIKLTKEAKERTSPRRPAVLSIMPNGLKFLVGHCLSYAIMLMVRSALKQMGYRKPTASEHIRDVALSILDRQLLLNQSSPVAQHHYQQCVAIP